MRLVLRAAGALALVALAGCGGSGGDASGPGGKVTIVFWHGQSGPAQKALDGLAAEYVKAHPAVTIQSNSGGVTTDDMLQKVTTAVAAGTYPDVAYLYGSWAANIARSPKVHDLTAEVHQPGFGWNDFWPAEREAATVGDEVIGVPAAAGDLAIFYNESLFRKLGIPFPTPSWTWQDFRDIAKRCTDPSTQTYGTGWPGDASEDTTWRLWPLLWQNGGEILTGGGKQAAFASAAGVRAMTLLQQMAVDDKSIYVDPTNSKMEQLFLGGKMCMFESGPWALLDLKEAKFPYGQQILPGTDGDHSTIAGADNWVVFDHGSSARVHAAVDFVRWLTAPAQDVRYATATGALPVRAGTTKQPSYGRYLARWKGIDLFARILGQAKSRPTVTQYPQISSAVGNAVVAVLLGKASPADALHQAAAKADALLAVPS